MSTLGPASGEAHHKAKLTQEQVDWIRHPDQADRSNADLAREVGVSRSTVRMIRANMMWRDDSYTPTDSAHRGSGYKPGRDPGRTGR